MRMQVVMLMVLASACRSAVYESGDLRCAAVAPFCPNGFHCATDNTCWLDGEDPKIDLGVHADDMSVGDQAADLLVLDDAGCPVVDPASCCGTLSTVCGATVNCTGVCGVGQICGGGIPNQCSCSTDTRSPIFRAVASDGRTCYSAGDPALCPGFVLDSTAAFYLYAADPPTGMVALSRCHDGTLYYLSLDATCGGSSSADLTLGYIPTSAACGAVALHRYDTGATGFVYTTNAASAPAGSTEATPPFFIWTN